MNKRGGYKQEDPGLCEAGGLAGLAKMMAMEFGALDMPPGPGSWNYNLPLPWGKKVRGMGFEAVAKATKEAMLKMYKQQVEKHDPNINLAHKLMMVSKLLGVPIPTTPWSFMIMPANVFPPPVGIGPPLTAWSIGYHALGLGMFNSGSDDCNKSEEDKAVENALSALFENMSDSLTGGEDDCEET